MNNLNLPNPKMMDVAVPANMRIGLARDIVAERGWTVTAEEAKEVLGEPDVALVDLREDQERRKDGIIPGSLHVPYPDVEESLKAEGLLATPRKRRGQASHLLLHLRPAVGHGGAGGASRGSHQLRAISTAGCRPGSRRMVPLSH